MINKTYRAMLRARAVERRWHELPLHRIQKHAAMEQFLSERVRTESERQERRMKALMWEEAAQAQLEGTEQ